MDLQNDLVFAALLSILTTGAVWLLEKLPVKFTTDQRPVIAQGIGAFAGFAYSFAPVYEFLNRAPLPAGATPGLYIVGGWWAGLAAIGIHQTVKRTGTGNAVGIGLLVVTLAAGSAGIALSGCSYFKSDGPSLADVLDAAKITQPEAKKALIKIQDARTAALKAFAIVYVTAPKNDKLNAAKETIEYLDDDFRKHWGKAALAVDNWSPSVFVREYTITQQRVAAMKSATPK